MKKWPVLFLSLGLVLALAGGVQAVSSPPRVLMVCTGEGQGVFNALGEGLVSALKKDMPGRGIQISNTSGARTNCKMVGEEVMDLGFTHGETLYFAATGDPKGGFTRPLPNIRAVAALYGNYLHVMASKDSGITTLEGLKGKKIALGPAGSGTAVTAGLLLDALGFKSMDMSRVVNQPVTQNPNMFRQKTLDAAIVVQGLPSSLAAKSLAAGAVLLPLTPEAYEQMASINKQYHYQPIPKGTYPGQDQDVPTVTINTILITNTKVDNETVYMITKALFAHADVLAAAHPVGKQISLQRATQNLPVPLHPGAERFYKEKGILK